MYWDKHSPMTQINEKKNISFLVATYDTARVHLEASTYTSDLSEAEPGKRIPRKRTYSSDGSTSDSVSDTDMKKKAAKPVSNTFDMPEVPITLLRSNAEEIVFQLDSGDDLTGRI